MQHSVTEAPPALEKQVVLPDDHASDKPKPASDVEAKDENEDPKGSMKDFFRIFQYTTTFDRLLYAIAFAGAIITGATLPLMTLVFGSSTSSFNNVAAGQDIAQFQTSINPLILYFVYLFIARFVLGYVSTLCICTAATRTTNSLRKAFLDSLMRKDMAYFDTSGHGSPATQVTTNGNQINTGIAEKLFTLIFGISLFFSAYVVALAIQWKLALITMSIIPALFIMVGACVALVVPIENRIGRVYSQAGTLAQDALGSIKTIHAFGAQNKILKWYDQHLDTAYKDGLKKSPLYGILFSSQSFLTMSGTALAWWQGFRMYQSGEIPDVGKVITVILSITLGAGSTLFIIPQFSAFTAASAAAAELFSVIDAESPWDPLSDAGLRPDQCLGNIEIRDLHFAYPSRPLAPVLRGLNLIIPAGKTTALVGASGAGKSSVVGLLERWYQPSSGTILLDGQELNSLNSKWLRSNVRLVQQEPTLFADTIFGNISHGLVGQQIMLSADDRRNLVIEACKAANAHDFIQRLPQGYDTQIGERAATLSGGQRQRLSIARSIISNPRILLLDEATSALDPEAEMIVQKALDKVSVDKTTLVIAHKLATIQRADNIAVMSDGVVVEQGTHADLFAADGMYAAMVRGQDLRVYPGADQSSASEKQAVPAESDDYDTLEKMQTAVATEDESRLTRGTLDLSLIRCIVILLREAADLYPWFILMTFVYVILAGTYPAQALLFSRLINVFTVQGEEASSQANLFSLMFFVVALANLLGFLFIGTAVNTIGQKLTRRTRHEMLDRILHMDQAFFDCKENTSGSLTAKLSSMPSSLDELMSSNLGLIVNVIFNIIASALLGIAYGWRLGLTLTFAGLTLIVGGGYVRIRLDQKLESATEKQYTSSASLAAEAVGAIRTVSLLTMEESVLQRYSATLDDIATSVIRSLTITLLPYALSQSVDLLVLALGFWYGARLLAAGEYTVQQFFVVFISVIFGGQAAAQFFTYTTSITKAREAANYFLWLRTLKPTISETEENHNRKLPEDELRWQMEKVSFSYPQRCDIKVLQDASATIEPGSYAAFVGASGSGKSTVVGLLERFYDPTSGVITINSEPIDTISPSHLRSRLSLVQQEPPLYLGSVRDNIALGLSSAPTDEEMTRACRQANVLDFVSSLPDGLNTQCGARGAQFSGGQRQRIAVARALIRQPRLLLLDEATSALDSASEALVQGALDEAARDSGRTTVAVAHRLSTIRHADVIFVLDRGRIVEWGTHDELVAKRARYHAMCLAQSLDQPVA